MDHWGHLKQILYLLMYIHIQDVITHKFRSELIIPVLAAFVLQPHLPVGSKHKYDHQMRIKKLCQD